MGHEEPLKRQGFGYSQLMPWTIAVVFISLLGACFIASSLITHYNFARCKRGMEEIILPEDHVKLTCSREQPALKGSAWNCCPVGWKVFQSHCYLPFNSKKIWAETESPCRSLGAHLASISNEAEQNFIIQFLDRRFSYFLGPTDDNVEDKWYWVDNTPFNPRMEFQYQGEPSNNPEEYCLALVNDQDKWVRKNISCNFARSYICKAPGVRVD
ncbi:C-type lectin domain family 4 member D [Sorex fumeus]|uniref:C-type lectin domain family 4 member D n=1 Tax=Sorex fumeus TaxID=62283 RepID=UPI0024AE33F8|nr:C-type lectin domain family 4 member D [Sorex fumeus]